ncbi:MAG TPA: glycosyl hydrolase family 18 protein [Ktedonobacteraceae bacterium]|nr:glycosyl hydrolase family 18 protein [Ktedonobacteraceae bacterium]
MSRTMLRSGKVLSAACLSLVLSQCFTMVVSALPHVAPARLPQAHLHRVIYYYQTLTDLSPVIKSLNPVTKKPYPTDINLGAFHLGPQSDGTLLHLNDHPPNDPVYNTPWKQLAKLQSLGVKLHMMLGGAGCCSFKSLFSNWKKLYPVLKQTLRNYHFNGVDLDIEESVALSNAQRLIDQLSSDFGSRFLITLAPVASDLMGGGGLSGFNYKDLYQADGSKIAWFNTQFYNGFGSLASTSDYNSAISNGFPPDKVVAGMLGNSHDGRGYVEMNQIAKTVKLLARKYTNFGGVFSWEYFDTMPGGTANPQLWSQLMIQTMDLTQTPSSGAIS